MPTFSAAYLAFAIASNGTAWTDTALLTWIKTSGDLWVVAVTFRRVEDADPS